MKLLYLRQGNLYLVGYKRWILTPDNAEESGIMKTRVELVKENKVNDMNIMR